MIPLTVSPKWPRSRRGAQSEGALSPCRPRLLLPIPPKRGPQNDQRFFALQAAILPRCHVAARATATRAIVRGNLFAAGGSARPPFPAAKSDGRMSWLPTDQHPSWELLRADARREAFSIV